MVSIIGWLNGHPTPAYHPVLYYKRVRILMRKEGLPVSDQELSSTPPGDISATWGFHLLQELRRMEDKMDTKIDGLEAKMDTKIDGLEAKMDTKIDGLHRELDTKIDSVRREMDTKIDGLRYWSWATIIVVIVAAITTILTLHS